MEQDLKSGRSRWLLFLIAGLALLFFVCIVVQILLAGVGLFVDHGNWGYHTTFIHLFEFIPLIMFVLSFSRGIPSTLRWQCVGLYFMIVLQYITIVFSGALSYSPAFHLVIASLLFWRSLVTASVAVKLAGTEKSKN